MERAGVVGLRWAAAVATVALVVVVAWRLTTGEGLAADPYPIPGERLPWSVEVLNGTDADGLARLVTFRLRHAGFDVVFYGTASSQRETTAVILRGGDAAAAADVQAALGLGTIIEEPEPGLLVDVTVVLGRDAVPDSVPNDP